jgi:hypothetical protein
MTDPQFPPTDTGTTYLYGDAVREFGLRSGFIGVARIPAEARTYADAPGLLSEI